MKGKILSLLILFPVFAEGELQTLKIMDQQGLVRGVKQIEGSATVIVESQSSDLKITLQSLDKIEPEREGDPEGSKVIFRGVSSGMWRITGSQEGVTKVTIAEE